MMLLNNEGPGWLNDGYDWLNDSPDRIKWLNKEPKRLKLDLEKTFIFNNAWKCKEWQKW